MTESRLRVPRSKPLSGTRKKKPNAGTGIGFLLPTKCLAVSYFHMGKPHTIIGAERLHYRVRDGIGWFPLAIATKQSKSRESP